MVLRPAVRPNNAIGGDHVLAKFGLSYLNDNGYINYDDPYSIDPDFAKDRAGKQTGAWMRRKQRNILTEEDRTRTTPGPTSPWLDPARWGVEGEPEHIHPALQQSQWVLPGGDDDWKAIRPSVELASRIIDDPLVLPFLHGLSSQPRPLHDPKLQTTFAEKGLEGPPYTWNIHDFAEARSANVRRRDELAAWLHLASFRDRIRWKFNYDGKEVAAGVTQWNVPNSTCTVVFNTDFLEVLREELDPLDYSRPWDPGTDRDAAKLRTQTLLALAIIHEFAHCTWLLSRNKNIPGPYLDSQPINEVGHAFENHVLTGIIQPMGRPSSLTVPYGVKIVRFPSIFSDYEHGDDLVARGLPPEWGVNWSTSYPVKMACISKLYGIADWDMVARFGLEHMGPVRYEGVRERYTEPDTSVATIARSTRRRSRSRSPEGEDRDYRDRTTIGWVQPARHGSMERDELADRVVRPYIPRL